MQAERKRVFRRINELAAANPVDDVWRYLSDAFADPDELLGGKEPE
jgi:uncharacterized circularly permuted ATP-grasp superfamily protein